MNIKEIIETYQNRYNEKDISEKLSEDILSITPQEYADYYKDLYNQHFPESKLDSTLSSLDDYNNYFEKKIKNEFNNDECIFDIENGDAYNFFIELNKSSFVRDLLDEDAKHFVLDKGSKLDGALSSVCTKKDYQQNISAIDMYAEAWWKLNKSHSFSNGNKRTSFLGVKSWLFTDIFLNFIDNAVFLFINGFRQSINENVNIENLHKHALKQSNIGWKKPSLDDINDFINEFMDDIKEEIFDKLSLIGTKSREIIDRVTFDIAKSVSNQITSDYVLSKFIAKINLDDYLANDEQIRKEVHSIIKAELIIAVLVNQQYILPRKHSIINQINESLNEFVENKNIIEIIVSKNRKKLNKM